VTFRKKNKSTLILATVRPLCCRHQVLNRNFFYVQVTINEATGVLSGIQYTLLFLTAYCLL
jgi:hypothetical protein